MLLSKQQSLLLTLQLAGLVAGASTSSSARPSLAVSSSWNPHPTGLPVIEELVYEFTHSIIPSDENELRARGNNPKPNHHGTTSTKRASSTSSVVKPPKKTSGTPVHANPATQTSPSVAPVTHKKSSAASAPPSDTSSKPAGSGNPHPGPKKSSSASADSKTDGHHPHGGVTSDAPAKTSATTAHTSKSSTNHDGSGNSASDASTNASPAPGHGHGSSASKTSPGVTPPPHGSGTRPASTSVPDRTSMVISAGSSMITPQFQATEYPEYANITAPLTTSTTDAEHHTIGLAIWPGGRAWKCTKHCTSPGGSGGGGEGGGGKPVPLPKVAPKPPSIKPNNPKNPDDSNNPDDPNNPDDSDDPDNKSTKDHTATTSDSSSTESSSSSASSSSGGSSHPALPFMTPVVDHADVKEAAGVAAAQSDLESEWDSINAAATPRGSTLSSRPSKTSDHTSSITEDPSTTAEHTTTDPPSTTTSATDDNIIHKASTTTSDNGAVLAWASQSVKKDGDSTKTVGAGEPTKVLPDVTSVETHGLSSNCYLIEDDCDDAVHQFIEKGWENENMKTRTARYHRFNGSLISAKCIVSYECGDDDKSDYGSGLTGRQVYDTYWREKHNDKFGKCAKIKFNKNCHIKADYCYTDCPAWNDGS